jgi:hypothetical protein
MKNSILAAAVLVLSTLISSNALAAAPRPPAEPKPPVTKPPVNKPPVSTPPESVQPPPIEASPIQQGPVTEVNGETLPSLDSANEVSYPVGAQVDDYYKNYRQLLVQRSPASSHRLDSCDPNLDNSFRFADRIAYQVQLQMNDHKAEISSIASYYGLPKSSESYFPTSLIRHPMCNLTSSTLSQTINKVPSAAVIAKANQFVTRYNGYRQKALAGDPRAYAQLNRLWGRLMMCLSYTESLTTADTKTSDNIAARVGPEGYRRPAGVLFYDDPAQSAASRLNIGLFQFTPTASGNINSCLRQWNKVYPTCSISTTSSQAELIKVLGSSYQTFNAFCGVNKVLQTFAVQANTQTASATHPSNKLSNGKLKPSGERCVSLHFQAGKAYNHFGPFQNSTGSNMNELLTCTLAQED